MLAVYAVAPDDVLEATSCPRLASSASGSCTPAAGCRQAHHQNLMMSYVCSCNKSGSESDGSSGLSSAISKSSSISMSGSRLGSPTTGAGRLVNGRSWFLWSVRRRPWPSYLFTLSTGMSGMGWSSTIYGSSSHLSAILCFPLMPSFYTSTLSPTTSLFSWTFRS